ncbi:unnamed protein product, partial [Dovyalis caffra]
MSNIKKVYNAKRDLLLWAGSVASCEHLRKGPSAALEIKQYRHDARSSKEKRT